MKNKAAFLLATALGVFSFFYCICVYSQEKPVVWEKINTEKEFWKALYSQDNVVILFSAEWCGPCHAAKKWWEIFAAPKKYRFFYWEIRKEDIDTDIEKRILSLTASFHPENQRSQNTAFPFISVIYRAHPGALTTSVTKRQFGGYDECTVGLQKFFTKDK